MALRHDCFIVYDSADRAFADAFVQRFRDVFVPRTRGISEADGLTVGSAANRDQLLHQIRDRCVWTATLTIVLTGACTWARRHVDWEIAAALHDDPLRPRIGRGDPDGRPTGLLGIRLPSLPVTAPAVVPERFADNVDAGYADFRGYPASAEELRYWVEGALVKAQYGLPDNSRPLRLEDGACHQPASGSVRQTVQNPAGTLNITGPRLSEPGRAPVGGPRRITIAGKPPVRD